MQISIQFTAERVRRLHKSITAKTTEERKKAIRALPEDGFSVVFEKKELDLPTSDLMTWVEGEEIIISGNASYTHSLLIVALKSRIRDYLYSLLIYASFQDGKITDESKFQIQKQLDVYIPQERKGRSIDDLEKEKRKLEEMIDKVRKRREAMAL